MPLRRLSRARRLGVLLGLLSLRCFERAVDHPQADLGTLVRQLAQLLQLGRIEVGADGLSHEHRYRLTLGHPLHRGAHGGSIQLEVVYSPPVR